MEENSIGLETIFLRKRLDEAEKQIDEQQIENELLKNRNKELSNELQLKRFIYLKEGKIFERRDGW